MSSNNGRNRSRIPIPRGGRPSGSKGVSYFEMERKRRGLDCNAKPPPSRMTAPVKVDNSRPPTEGDEVHEDNQFDGDNNLCLEAASELQQRLITETVAPAISPYNTFFMDGQGDKNEKEAGGNKMALAVVTSEGDSSCVRKPSPTIESLHEELTIPEIKDESKDEKEVRVLYENPQSRLELALDTSEESFDAEATSSMDLIDFRASENEMNEVPSAEYCLTSEQLMHELVEDQDEEEDILFEDRSFFRRLPESEDMSESEVTNENLSEAKICEEDSPETILMLQEDSSRPEMAEEDCSESLEMAEEDCSRTDIIKDHSCLSCIQEESDEGEQTLDENDDDEQMLDENDDDEQMLAENDDNEQTLDENACIHSNEIESSCSAETEKNKFSPQDHEELGSKESGLVFSGTSSFEEMQSIPCEKEQSFYEIDEYSDNEMDGALKDFETYFAKDESCSVQDLLAKVSSSNLDVSVKAIISDIIIKSIEGTSSSAQLSDENELGQSDNTEKEQGPEWAKDFKKKAKYCLDHERLLEEFDNIKIKDAPSEQGESDLRKKATKKVSEGYLEAVKKFTECRMDKTEVELPEKNEEQGDMQIFFAKKGGQWSIESLSLNCFGGERDPEYKSKRSVANLIHKPGTLGNFQKIITQKHNIKQVVPETVTLSKVLKFKRGVPQKPPQFCGDFTFRNPTDHFVAFEFSCNKPDNRFHLSRSQGVLKPHSSVDIRVYSRIPDLTDDLLEGTKLFLRTLGLVSEQITDEDVATLLKRDRQKDKPTAKRFVIIPHVEKIPAGDSVDLEETKKNLKLVPLFRKFKKDFANLAEEMKDLSTSAKFVTTSAFVCFIIYLTFGINLKLIWSSLDASFFGPFGI